MIQEPITTEIVPSVLRASLSPQKVTKEFFSLVDRGAKVVMGKAAKQDFSLLMRSKLKPKHKIELFDTRFYFTHVLQIPELRFFVTYVVQNVTRNSIGIFPRIVYKDLSLVWRAASHFTSVDGEIWIGKGDVIEYRDGEHEMIVSNESTTDLPFEMQSAVESLLSHTKRPGSGKGILDLVLRRAPENRVAPYQDFVRPRQKAWGNPKNRIHRGKSIAKFTRKNDPSSLTIVNGFEPDFQKGIVEHGHSRSRLYGGHLDRYRILSTNRKIQYLFFAGARHVWIAPPQALTTELSSFGVRTIDVAADDDLFIPGFEYHHYEETSNGLELYSQIPEGFVGSVCELDDAKADASPWLDRLPLVQRFRDEVLKGR